MTINMYEPRTMLAAIEQMLPVRTFFKDTFFKNVETFDTEKVDVDTYKGKRRMAPFVSPRIGGKAVERMGFRTDTYTPPLVAPNLITTADTIAKRLPGENVYSAKSPEERAASILGKDLSELDEMITRREEWMCAQALFTGKVVMKGEGVDQEIDFNLTNMETLSGSDKWTDPNSDPMADIKAWALQIMEQSGYNPNILIMATDVIDTFVNHPKIQKLLDLRLLNTGIIDPKQLPNGVIYHGRLNELGIDIYSYNEWYEDEETGDNKPMVPEKTVLLASDSARFSMYYGAVTIMKDDNFTTFEAPRVPDSWSQKSPAARFVQVSSRPLPVPHFVDSYYVAVVK